jgi:three-Cys-motif partner protein
LLKNYLERLLMIVGMSGGRQGWPMELCYVDCFAGPWGDPSESLAGTSIAISLKTMADCCTTLRRKGIQVAMRALFIERNSRTFDRLKSYLAESCPSNVDADCLNGDFVDLRQYILNWCGRNAFTFFFVDPTGWKDVGVSILQPLLQRPRSEFLINFMYEFINRNSVALPQQMAEFLGCNENTIKQLDGLSIQEREKQLVQAYRKGLKHSFVSARGLEVLPRLAHVRVMNPAKHMPKYHLIYLTSHPKGITEFMETSEKLDWIQRQICAEKVHSKKEQKTGTLDLFGEESFMSAAPAPHEVDSREVDGFWLSYLSECESKRIGVVQMADFLEYTGWMPKDFQKSLRSLIAEGYVRNEDASGKRSKRPLHYEVNHGEGERLILVPLDQMNQS